MDMNQVSSEVSVYTDRALKLLFDYGPNVLLALLTLVIGLWIIKVLSKGFGRSITKGQCRSFT